MNVTFALLLDLIVRTSNTTSIVSSMTTAQELVDLVRSYVGCSLKNRADELGELVACGVDDPKKIVGIKTNCATFSRGIMKKAGIVHPILEKPYVIGHAISDLIQIGTDLGIIHKWDGKTLPTLGSCMLYHSNGNDWHAEWLLSEPNSHNVALHGGGGRADNAITESISLVTWNCGRSLHQWLDVAAGLTA